MLNYLKSLSPLEDLSLKQLTLNVVMLSALVSAARCSFLHQMDLNFCYFKNDGYVFLVPGLVKGSKPHKLHLEIFLHFHLTLHYVLFLTLRDTLILHLARGTIHLQGISYLFRTLSLTKPSKLVDIKMAEKCPKIIRYKHFSIFSSFNKICILNVSCELWSFHIRYYESCRLVQSWNIQEIL